MVIFNEGLAKVAEQYLKKGSTIYVEGQLQTRKWTDKDGVERYSTEVVLQNYRGELTMVGARRDGDRDGPGTSSPDDYGGERTRSERPAAGGGAPRDLDDEVPF